MTCLIHLSGRAKIDESGIPVREDLHVAVGDVALGPPYCSQLANNLCNLDDVTDDVRSRLRWYRFSKGLKNQPLVAILIGTPRHRSHDALDSPFKHLQRRFLENNRAFSNTNTSLAHMSIRDSINLRAHGEEATCQRGKSG